MWTPSQARGNDNHKQQQNDREHYDLQSAIHFACASGAGIAAP